MSDDKGQRLGVHIRSRGGGKRQFVGGKPCRYSVLRKQPASALRRFLRLLGIKSEATDQAELSELIVRQEQRQ